MDDPQQQKKPRKTSFLRKLFNKITNKPIEPEEVDNDEDFEVIDNNDINLEQAEQVIQGENQEGDEENNVNVGNELAQELRAAFELYSKVRISLNGVLEQLLKGLKSFKVCFHVCCLWSVLTS